MLNRQSFADESSSEIAITPRIKSDPQEGITPGIPGKQYSGLIKSFNARRGFGFIVCKETADEHHRDVFISKGERDKNGLQEGDPCIFELQFSVEGHPQAVNVEKIQRYQGRVTSCMRDGLVTFGPIDRSTWPLVKGVGNEVTASKADAGILVLYPNDKVSFQLDPRGENQRPMASMILLQDTASSSTLSSCFEVEAPLYCRGHTIGSEIFLSLPEGTDLDLLKKVLPKIGATNVSIAEDGSAARAQFSSLQVLMKVLNHRSLGLPTIEGGNTVAAVQMSSPTCQSIPFWPAPLLLRSHNELHWEQQSNAQYYTLEVRLPSSSSWIALDAHGRPTPLVTLNYHITSVNFTNLGHILEARLSYVTLCGCSSSFGRLNFTMSMSMHPKGHVHSKLPAPGPPEILRQTQHGISIRWSPIPDVHGYIIETMRTNGEFYAKNVAGQSYVELMGGDHLWSRLAYIKHGRTSPFSQKLLIPPRTNCTWTVDEVTMLPRRRCSWDQRREPLVLWLD